MKKSQELKAKNCKCGLKKSQTSKTGQQLLFSVHCWKTSCGTAAVSRRQPFVYDDKRHSTHLSCKMTRNQFVTRVGKMQSMQKGEGTISVARGSWLPTNF